MQSHKHLIINVQKSSQIGVRFAPLQLSSYPLVAGSGLQTGYHYPGVSRRTLQPLNPSTLKPVDLQPSDLPTFDLPTLSDTRQASTLGQSTIQTQNCVYLSLFGNTTFLDSPSGEIYISLRCEGANIKKIQRHLVQHRGGALNKYPARFAILRNQISVIILLNK